MGKIFYSLTYILGNLNKNALKKAKKIKNEISSNLTYNFHELFFFHSNKIIFI